MFFCEKCRKKNGWGGGNIYIGWARSRGVCEICGKNADCYDVPSQYLPDPKPPRPKSKKKKALCSPIERMIAHTEIPGGWVIWAVTDREGSDKEFVIQAHDDRPADIIRLPANNYDVAVAAYTKRVEQVLQELKKG